MKKILLVIMLVLLLTGCSEVDNPDYYIDDWEREDRLEFIDGLRDCYDVNFDDEDCMVQDVRFYTKEEIDLMLQEIYDGFEDIESNDGYIENTYVSHSELDSMFTDYGLDIHSPEDFVNMFDDYEDYVANKIIELEARIEELESKNYVEESYLWADFYDSFGEDIIEYMEEYYQPIDECDSDCMIDRIDREIIIMTIAQIDIILYGLENSQEPLTDEEQYVLDLYTALRALMYLELEEE